MAGKKHYSVGPHTEGGWQVRRDKAERASSVHETKDAALKAGTKLAKKHETELRIKGKDGKIQDSDSYGKDPYPPKDKKH